MHSPRGEGAADELSLHIGGTESFVAERAEAVVAVLDGMALWL